MKAICVGHSTYDTTLPMNAYPIENFKYRIENHIECGGGPASNGAYLLAKWGIETTICSVIGDDYYGDRIIDEFKKIGANTKYLEKRKNYQTSSSFIIANMSNGLRTIITSKKDPIKKLDNIITDKADLILIDGEHPETALEVLNNNPDALSVIDAGRLTEDTLKLGKKVKYLVCSKEFAERFSKKKIDISNLNSLIEVYNELKIYFQNTVIITLEAAGSFTQIDGQYKIIPSIKVTAKDSTGAGEKAIHYASITSAISVTKIGSRFSIPKLEEVLNYDNII